MKKPLIYLLLSLSIAAVLAAFTSISISDSILDTIYTVSGVIFSVGMSITISPKTDRVINEKIKQSIRASYIRVRNSFFILFGFSTILYIISGVVKIEKYPMFFFYFSSVFILLSIAHYTYNFVRLQSLGEQIEDQVIKEIQTKR